MDSNPPNPSSPPHSTTTTTSTPSATTTTTTSTAAARPTTSSAQIQSSLRSLNKSSYKISKPSSTTLTTTNRPSPPPPPLPIPSPAEPTAAVAAADPNPSSSIAVAPPQPPVYNIDKNNFREIVQKLTGSISPVPPRPAAPAPPAAISTPPIPPLPQPQPQPQPHPSRLHRIRPPPLANLSARPPSIAPHQLLSPLPPLPSVGVTAESPISAYMRRLHGGTTMDAPPLPPPPLSPLGFGCLQSPRTAYQMMMMSSAGLPTSPGLPPLPAPSPRGER